MMITAIIFLTLGFSLLFAKLSRMAGGGAPKLPLGLDQWIYAIPYGVAAGFVGTYIEIFVSFALAFLGKRLGHGQYFDLGMWTRTTTAEKIDFIVRIFYGKDINTIQDNVAGNPKRDLFGLSLTGLVVGLGLGITLIINGAILFGILVLLAATAKGYAYYICKHHEITVRKVLSAIGIKFDEEHGHTEPAEWVTGFIGGLPVFAFIFISILL